MRSPTGAEPQQVRVFGDPATGAHVLTGDHWLTVPADQHDPARGTLELYAREVRAPEHADDDQPYLLFLQGGPGGRSPRPGADGPGWLSWATERFRVLLLDQRGTGRSTPLDRHSLAALGTPAVQAERLALHRADRIVDDAEALRRHLLGDVPWTVLGQSFGGFCTWTYLSRAPQGLAGAYVTGGVPPMGAHPDDVYRATHAQLARRVADLDEAHPHVREVLADVARHLDHTEEYLPTGERLTTERLQGIGIVLGGVGGLDTLAHLADDAWALPGRALSDTFLAGVASIISYATNPLYALVHEACYAERGVVTNWSAQRVRDELGVPASPVTETTASGREAERLPLTAEMIYPQTVARDPALAPLAETAELLAQRAWTEPLYDPARLAVNQVPVAACLYTQDIYVDPALSRAAAARTGGVRLIEDDVHHHDGLRRAGADVLGALEQALAGSAGSARSTSGESSPGTSSDSDSDRTDLEAAS